MNSSVFFCFGRDSKKSLKKIKIKYIYIYIYIYIISFLVIFFLVLFILNYILIFIILMIKYICWVYYFDFLNIIDQDLSDTLIQYAQKIIILFEY